MPAKPTGALLAIMAIAALAAGCGPKADGASSARVEGSANVASEIGENDSIASADVERTDSRAAADSPAVTEVVTTERPAPKPDAEPAARPAFQFPGRKSTGRQDLTFDDLKFAIQKDERFERSMLGEKIESLAGQTIRIRGFMLPHELQSGITEFVLVRDNRECCFGPGAALYDCIRVSMQGGESTEFSVRPIAVRGVLRIEPFVDPEGKHLAIYRLEAQEAG